MLPNIATVTFEDNSNLLSIGDYAFYKCKATEITLPAMLTEIGNYAFYGASLRQLILPDTTVSVGDYAFYANTDLNSVTFGKGLQSLGESAFYYCKKLSSVDLSQTKLISLGGDCFKACSELVAAVFPSTLTQVGAAAFKGCDKLKVASLGNGVESLGESVFEGCSSMQVVILPQALTSIGNSAFKDCVSVEKLLYYAKECLDLPADNKLFYNFGATNGVSVVFGETVEYIPAKLFYATSNAQFKPNIKSITVDGNGVSVGEFAFFGIDTKINLLGGFNASNVGEGNDLILGDRG